MKVAIIGAGASGLASAQEFKSRGHQVTVFEQGSKPGGVWAYSAEEESDLLGKNVDTRVYSSLYEDLRTNLPTDLMAFKGFPFNSSGGGDDSWPRFPHHSSVYQYLMRYIEKYELESLIQCGARVERIQIEAGVWQVKILGRITESFDVVVVCSGHFSEPRLPEISGMSEFGGKMLHSHNYRRAEAYKGKSVAVLGCGASGADIAQELLESAKQVIWAGFEEDHEPGKMMLTTFPTCFTKTGFKTAKKQFDVDVILFCTGYRYELPFLPQGLLTVEDNFVSPLYRDIVHPDVPSLGFVGLPFLVVPFPLYAMQAKWFASCIDKDFDLPGGKQMLQACQDKQAQLASRGIKRRHYHRLGLEQETYYNLLADECHAPRMPEWFGELVLDAQKVRQAHPGNFRDVPLGVSRRVHL